MTSSTLPLRRHVLAGLAVMAAAPLAAIPARAETAEFATREYWTKLGPVSLYIFRKQLAVAPAAPRPVLFLAHGSTVSSRPSFDLVVPEAGEYSLMNVFARLGYDVWTMDFEGYGRSGPMQGNSDIRTGAGNIRAAAEVIRRETGQARMHLLGESSGALRAGVFAMENPDRVGRLVLEAFTYTGRDSPTLGLRGQRLAFFRENARRPRLEADITQIFTRDAPGTSDARVPVAMAAAELPFGDSVPTGSYLDMTANLPVVDPAKVLCPVLMIRGEHDGIATEADLLDFFAKLPSFDRQYVVLPNSAHSIGLGLTRAQFWHAVHAFLSLPQGA
ncbi:MAG: alpha/beta hydrolase [Janthinobacterium lividum]